VADLKSIGAKAQRECGPNGWCGRRRCASETIGNSSRARKCRVRLRFFQAPLGARNSPKFSSGFAAHGPRAAMWGARKATISILKSFSGVTFGAGFEKHASSKPPSVRILAAHCPPPAARNR